MLIDPSAITLVQTTFLSHINSAFSVVTRYALNLLYLFTALEVVVFGLLWAFQQGAEWSKLFFKIIKIGLIFFLIQNYPMLIDSIVKSFAILGGAVANTKHLSQIIFNPTAIWQYGYDVSLALLKAAASGSAFGLTLIQTLLGIGNLLVFGLLGIQIVLQLVAFYLISLVALILIPFGVFNPSANMLEKGMQNVFKAGVRVMVLIAVIGIAVTIFAHFAPIDLTSSTAATDYNISQFLGLFFTALLFLCLAIFLPKLAADTVGELSMRGGEVSRAPIVIAPGAGGASFVGAATTVGGASDMQAATAVQAGSYMAGQPTGIASPQAVTVTAASAGSTTSSGGILGGAGASKDLAGGAAIAKSLKKQSISLATLKKINKNLEKIAENKG